jgi:hypothetical protein
MYNIFRINISKQLVTIAVYAYFAAALFGRQGLDDSGGKSIVGYEHIGGFFDSIPIFLTLEFVFFIGWLKAAEVLINPYGKVQGFATLHRIFITLLHTTIISRVSNFH